MIDFIGRRRIYAVVSLLMLTPALIGLAIWQFEAGLDFAGGLESEVRFLRDVGLPEIEDALDGAELADGVTVNASEGDEGTFVLETSLLTPDVALARESANAVIDGVVAELGSVVLVDASVEPDSARYEFWMAASATQDEVRGRWKRWIWAGRGFRRRRTRRSGFAWSSRRMAIWSACGSESMARCAPRLGRSWCCSRRRFPACCRWRLRATQGWRWRSPRWRF